MIAFVAFAAFVSAAVDDVGADVRVDAAADVHDVDDVGDVRVDAAADVHDVDDVHVDAGAVDAGAVDAAAVDAAAADAGAVDAAAVDAAAVDAGAVDAGAVDAAAVDAAAVDVDVRAKGDDALAAPDGAALPAPGGERRYAVVIGHNRGAANEVPLRFAVRDATRLKDALVAVAGFATSDIDLVVDEDADVVRRRLIAMNERVRVERSAGQASVLLVFSSGHADSEALHLGDTRLSFDELEGLVRGSAADFRLLAVDACKSGELTAGKGLRLTPRPVSIAPKEPSASGYVVLAAGAAAKTPTRANASWARSSRTTLSRPCSAPPTTTATVASP